jgi:hypothetical protein
MKLGFYLFIKIAFSVIFFCLLRKFQFDIDVKSENKKTSFEIRYEFDFCLKNDTLTFIHIQKTSGTYWINEMRKNLLARNAHNGWSNVCIFEPNEKLYNCYETRHDFNKDAEIFWNVNEHFGCDIHAGFAELMFCIQSDYRAYGTIHYTTILRNPQERYVSEFEHVKKGARWKNSVRRCKEQLLYKSSCYEGFENWTHVTWPDFLGCEYNLANNRQVRMLANYNELGCDSLKCWLKSSNCSIEMKRKYENDLLENAKKNLVSFSFFGLTEYQRLSQYLFEKTFKNKFKFSQPFSEINERIGLKSLEAVNRDYMNEINENNNLDIKLYDFATKIFFDRVAYFKDLDLKIKQID